MSNFNQDLFSFDGFGTDNLDHFGDGITEDMLESVDLLGDNRREDFGSTDIVDNVNHDEILEIQETQEWIEFVKGKIGNVGELRHNGGKGGHVQIGLHSHVHGNLNITFWDESASTLSSCEEELEGCIMETSKLRYYDKHGTYCPASGSKTTVFADDGSVLINTSNKGRKGDAPRKGRRKRKKKRTGTNNRLSSRSLKDHYKRRSPIPRTRPPLSSNYVVSTPPRPPHQNVHEEKDDDDDDRHEFSNETPAKSVNNDEDEDDDDDDHTHDFSTPTKSLKRFKQRSDGVRVLEETLSIVIKDCWNENILAKLGLKTSSDGLIVSDLVSFFDCKRKFLNYTSSKHIDELTKKTLLFFDFDDLKRLSRSNDKCCISCIDDVTADMFGKWKGIESRTHRRHKRIRIMRDKQSRPDMTSPHAAPKELRRIIYYDSETNRAAVVYLVKKGTYENILLSPVANRRKLRKTKTLRNDVKKELNNDTPSFVFHNQIVGRDRSSNSRNMPTRKMVHNTSSQISIEKKRKDRMKLLDLGNSEYIHGGVKFVHHHKKGEGVECLLTLKSLLLFSLESQKTGNALDGFDHNFGSVNATCGVHAHQSPFLTNETETADFIIPASFWVSYTKDGLSVLRWLNGVNSVTSKRWGRNLHNTCWDFGRECHFGISSLEKVAEIHPDHIEEKCCWHYVQMCSFFSYKKELEGAVTKEQADQFLTDTTHPEGLIRAKVVDGKTLSREERLQRIEEKLPQAYSVWGNVFEMYFKKEILPFLPNILNEKYNNISELFGNILTMMNGWKLPVPAFIERITTLLKSYVIQLRRSISMDEFGKMKQQYSSYDFRISLLKKIELFDQLTREEILRLNSRKKMDSVLAWTTGIPSTGATLVGPPPRDNSLDERLMLNDRMQSFRRDDEKKRKDNLRIVLREGLNGVNFGETRSIELAIDEVEKLKPYRLVGRHGERCEKFVVEIVRRKKKENHFITRSAQKNWTCGCGRTNCYGIISCIANFHPKEFSEIKGFDFEKDIQKNTLGGRKPGFRKGSKSTTSRVKVNKRRGRAFKEANIRLYDEKGKDDTNDTIALNSSNQFLLSNDDDEKGKDDNSNDTISPNSSNQFLLSNDDAVWKEKQPMFLGEKETRIVRKNPVCQVDGCGQSFDSGDMSKIIQCFYCKTICHDNAVTEVTEDSGGDIRKICGTHIKFNDDIGQRKYIGKRFAICESCFLKSSYKCCICKNTITNIVEFDMCLHDIMDISKTVHSSCISASKVQCSCEELDEDHQTVPTSHSSNNEEESQSEKSGVNTESGSESSVISNNSKNIDVDDPVFGGGRKMKRSVMENDEKVEGNEQAVGSLKRKKMI